MSRRGSTRKENPPWFSVAEAASILGISERAVQLRARKGTLLSRKEKSPETGRMRLLVTCEELTAGGTPSLPAAIRSLAREDFIPRFSRRLDQQAELAPEEWAELSADSESLDRGRCREDAQSELERALAREREEAARQERSLQRYIDRMQARHNAKEARLRREVDELALTLGRTEHSLLQHARPSRARRALAWLGRALRLFLGPRPGPPPTRRRGAGQGRVSKSR